MKLTDKAFTKGAASTKPGMRLDKKALREALSPTASAEAVFDKIAQAVSGRCNCENSVCANHKAGACDQPAGAQKAQYVGPLCDGCARMMPAQYLAQLQPDIMNPAMGVPQAQPEKKLTPIHEGMWTPRQIKKHYRKLRSMGYGIDDSDMAVSDVMRQGAGGAGAEDDRVKDYFRRLWYSTISTKPHEENLYKLAELETEFYKSAQEIPPELQAIVDQFLSEHPDGEEYVIAFFDNTPPEEINDFQLQQYLDIYEEGLEIDGNTEKTSQEMPMPPAAPGGDATPGVGEPPPPEEMMAPEEPEMSLSEALQQLEESAQAVVQKVQNGEMIDATGQDLIPELPADTGATPSPAPKIGQMEPEAAPSQMDKVRDEHGDEVADLLRMRDEASDMYNDERLRDRLPRGILNKLERSFKDWNSLTPAEFQEAYAAMKGGARSKAKPPVGIQQKSPNEMKAPSKPLVPGSAPPVKSKAEDRELIKQMIEKMKSNLPKVSVDQDAKDYWSDLFGEYGDQMTEDIDFVKDRLATVVDVAEQIFEQHGLKLDNDKFNKIVAFVADDITDRGSVYSLAAELARRDDRFASVVDGLLLNYVAKSAASYNEYPAFTKASMFVMAMHDAGSTDRVMSYIAQKMKTPKPKGQSDDAVKVPEAKDEAADSEPSIHSEHIKFDYSDPTIRGNYTYMTINWDSGEDSAKNRSDEGLKHAVISYVKGLESKKEFIDWGFLGRIHFSEFDPDAGMAEVYFRASKGGDAVPEVETD